MVYASIPSATARTAIDEDGDQTTVVDHRDRAEIAGLHRQRGLVQGFLRTLRRPQFEDDERARIEDGRLPALGREYVCRQIQPRRRKTA